MKNPTAARAISTDLAAKLKVDGTVGIPIQRLHIHRDQPIERVDRNLARASRICESDPKNCVYSLVTL